MVFIENEEFKASINLSNYEILSDNEKMKIKLGCLLDNVLQDGLSIYLNI